MKYYFKDGFYIEDGEDRIEINSEYYNKLLNGQANGKQIVPDENGYPILKDIELMTPSVDEQIRSLETEAQKLLPTIQAGIDVEYNQQKLINIMLEIEELKGNLE